MSIKKHHYYYQSALSILYLTVFESQILSLEYEVENVLRFENKLPSGDIKNWLDGYFAGHPLTTSPAMKIQGTDFQQKVWQVMLKIPYGETLSYGDVSKLLGSAPRAVGQACKRNPMPIIIPCHRIVAQHSVGGYEGATEGHRLDRKKWLLNHEQAK